MGVENNVTLKQSGGITGRDFLSGRAAIIQLAALTPVSLGFVTNTMMPNPAVTYAQIVSQKATVMNSATARWTTAADAIFKTLIKNATKPTAQSSVHAAIKVFAASYIAGFWSIAGARVGCERRGWGGLLALKTIRLGVVVPLALAYAKMFKDQELEEAHFGDLHHAAAAVPAEVFVTHDRRLRALIHRARVTGLEVMTLPQLLRAIDRRQMST
jgi:hypothetical protein